MANDTFVGVGVAAGGVPILPAVEALINSSRLCGRRRHRGLEGFVRNLGVAVDQAPDQREGSTWILREYKRIELG